MQPEPARVEAIVLAACVLHNILRDRYPSDQNLQLDREDPQTHDVMDGPWRDDEPLVALENRGGNTSTNPGKVQRLYLKDYYNSPVGRVPWQDRMV